MLFSVIIPTFNEERYISRCLASLQKQELDTHDEVEIIVIDDGSTDETVGRIKRFGDAKLLHQEHQGPAIARNQGAKMAKGDILVFVDADMEFEKNFIRNLVKPIKAKKEKGTFSKEEYVANWESSLARSWNWNENLPAKKRLHDNNVEVGSDFRAILKSEFKKVNGFDNVGYTDTWTLATKLEYKPSNATGAKFYHHNPSSFTEIFKHAGWVSKRRYKLGILGSLYALLRLSLPGSLAIGIYKTIKYKEPIFILFKPIYDLGASLGILQILLMNKTSK